MLGTAFRGLTEGPLENADAGGRHPVAGQGRRDVPGGARGAGRPAAEMVLTGLEERSTARRPARTKGEPMKPAPPVTRQDVQNALQERPLAPRARPWHKGRAPRLHSPETRCVAPLSPLPPWPRCSSPEAAPTNLR
ncbi:hypothetical protein GCM10018789_60660 [Streptomyces werraensis]|nr:hypothetical protein GCM10018789_60660 [Streptomyces werraensis]